MAPSDIARRLDQRLRLLASSDRLAPGRHRTLDAAVRWSYELLDETPRVVFDRCSVFAGPFTIEAAEAVVAGDGVEEWEVLDGILALVDKSLVVADEVSGGTRYRLLETMRQFGHANLATAGLADEYRGRHVDHDADYVLARAPRLRGRDDLGARREIERELENIRVALRHTADDHSSSRFDELYGLMYTIFFGRGRTHEGAAWAAELRTRPAVDPRARIVALGVAVQVLMQLDLAVAQELAAVAEELSASSGAAPPLVSTATSSVIALMHGDDAAAIAHHDRVMQMAPDEPEPFVRAVAYVNCTTVMGLIGDFDRMSDGLRTLAELADELDNRYLEAQVASSLVPVVHLIDPDGAEAALLRTYELHLETGNFQANISIAMFIALHYLRLGDAGSAADWARRALQLAIDRGPTYITQVISAVIAVVKRQAPARAAELLGALRAFRDRKALQGTQSEAGAEVGYERSLRRALGDEFDPHYAHGATLDEHEMALQAFVQLDAITAASDPAGPGAGD
jgi:hypothetical protein